MLRYNIKNYLFLWLNWWTIRFQILRFYTLLINFFLVIFLFLLTGKRKILKWIFGIWIWKFIIKFSVTLTLNLTGFLHLRIVFFFFLILGDITFIWRLFLDFKRFDFFEVKVLLRESLGLRFFIGFDNFLEFGFAFFGSNGLLWRLIVNNLRGCSLKLEMVILGYWRLWFRLMLLRDYVRFLFLFRINFWWFDLCLWRVGYELYLLWSRVVIRDFSC